MNIQRITALEGLRNQLYNLEETIANFLELIKSLLEGENAPSASCCRIGNAPVLPGV
jgi:hypothetical protein